MDAILFIHHLSLNESTTRTNLALVRAMNPDCEVFTLSFDKNRETPKWQWKNCDVLVYEWFEITHPKHDRYFILEWDCFCTQSMRAFYGGSVDYNAAGALVIQPWSDETILTQHGEPQTMRDWHWFAHNTSAELYPYLRGITPICGSMFSHDCLFNMVQLWKTNLAFDRLFSECRMGTLAAMAGYEPRQIRQDAPHFLHSGDVQIDHGPGVYHRVRL